MRTPVLSTNPRTILNKRDRCITSEAAYGGFGCDGRASGGGVNNRRSGGDADGQEGQDGDGGDGGGGGDRRRERPQRPV